MEDIKDLLKEDKKKEHLMKRKLQMNQKIWDHRLQNSSNHINSQRIEEEKEEKPRNSMKGFMPLNQFMRRHYHKRKKKFKRCWVCLSKAHLKRDCPKMRCFYCGRQGHIKKKCIWYELHKTLLILKGKEVADPKVKKTKINKKTATDRMKEVAFREEGKEHILVHKGVDLATYIGDYPFTVGRMGFDPPRTPKHLRDKVIKVDMPTRQLKYSDFLPHQCGSDGEVLNGKGFIIHCQTEHKGYVPAGSLINASPYRFWLLWWDDENFIRFMETRGESRYTRAKPPWC